VRIFGKENNAGKRTLEQLNGYHWPGNIRELQNVVEGAVILSETDTFVVDERWLKGESAESSRTKPFRHWKIAKWK
jgi:formate hydrogenlyase transcriptional activator